MSYFSESADLAPEIDEVVILEYIGLHGCAVGMPGILGWFQCDRGVCLRAGGAHNGLLVGSLQDFPQAACGDTPRSRVQTVRSVPILFLCLLLS